MFWRRNSRKEDACLKKKKGEITIRSSAAEYLTYVASVGDQQDSIEMRYKDENIWLTQKMMATLYDVDVRTINEHIKKIYSDSELEEEATIRNFRIVRTERPFVPDMPSAISSCLVRWESRVFT